MRFAGLIVAGLMALWAGQAVAEPLAKDQFGHMRLPAATEPRVHGSYSKGCFAGGLALAADGPDWQAMRLSRNRRWGHPEMIRTVERLAREARQDGWPGLLVGDISQPRGGPMLSGHASHQLGLDADIWFQPMPQNRMNAAQRENFEFVSMLRPGTLEVDDRRWTQAHTALLRRAAGYSQVERVLVHPGIKKKLCDTVRGDRSWLGKIRPIWGHDSHFHIRIGCPAGSPGCRPQEPVARGEGCDASLAWWFTDEPWRPATGPQKPRARDVMRMADLPNECRMVLAAPSPASELAATSGAAGFAPPIAASAYARRPTGWRPCRCRGPIAEAAPLDFPHRLCGKRSDTHRLRPQPMPPSADPRDSLPFPVLIGDIGGTNARFAVLAAPDTPAVDFETIATADHAQMNEAIATAILTRTTLRPRSALLAIAAPVLGDEIGLTNSHWTIRPRDMITRLGFEEVMMLNDFEAQALAVTASAPADLVRIGGGEPDVLASRVVLGPGTGLGVAGLVRAGEAWVPVPGEGGHVDIGPRTAAECAVFEHLDRIEGRISGEQLLCGRGLVNLYRAVAAARGVEAGAVSPADVTAGGLSGVDPLAVEALEIFVTCLGRIAGDLGLVFMSRGGVYLTGGIAQRIVPALMQPRFRAAFEDKAPHSGLMRAMPVFVMTHPRAPLQGLAALARAPQAFHIRTTSRRWAAGKTL